VRLPAALVHAHGSWLAWAGTARTGLRDTDGVGRHGVWRHGRVGAGSGSGSGGGGAARRASARARVWTWRWKWCGSTSLTSRVMACCPHATHTHTQTQTQTYTDTAVMACCPSPTHTHHVPATPHSCMWPPTLLPATHTSSGVPATPHTPSDQRPCLEPDTRAVVSESAKWLHDRTQHCTDTAGAGRVSWGPAARRLRSKRRAFKCK
jgi:hypothetical protein